MRTNLSTGEYLLVCYAVRAYAHLINHNDFTITARELAARIREVYSVDEPRNKEIAEALEKHLNLIIYPSIAFRAVRIFSTETTLERALEIGVINASELTRKDVRELRRVLDIHKDEDLSDRPPTTILFQTWGRPIPQMSISDIECLWARLFEVTP